MAGGLKLAANKETALGEAGFFSGPECSFVPSAQLSRSFMLSAPATDGLRLEEEEKADLSMDGKASVSAAEVA